ncbi:MAG: hypothetical protein GX557_07115 [Chloroflexi bacterium]|nr:hypothetical protein [Chloroflexota bacterium]
MPFWGAAVLSGALFLAGLAGILRPRDAAAGAALARRWSGLLMLNGALLLAVAAAHDLGALSGQALALLVLGVLAVEAALVARNG